MSSPSSPSFSSKMPNNTSLVSLESSPRERSNSVFANMMEHIEAWKKETDATIAAKNVEIRLLVDKNKEQLEKEQEQLNTMERIQKVALEQLHEFNDLKKKTDQLQKSLDAEKTEKTRLQWSINSMQRALKKWQDEAVTHEAAYKKAEQEKKDLLAMIAEQEQESLDGVKTVFKRIKSFGGGDVTDATEAVGPSSLKRESKLEDDKGPRNKKTKRGH